MRREGKPGWRIAGTLLAVGIVLAISHAWWLAALGRFLIQAEPPTKADLIVVLAGDWNGNRVLRGGQLVREGYAAQALVSGPRHHYGLREYELAIPFAVRHGYPESYFIPFPIEGGSTKEEADEIVGELRRRGVHRVLVVTSDYHTGRAGRIYHRAAPDLEIHLVAAPDAVFRAGDWWKSREAQKIFLLEWTKTVTSVVGI